MSNKARVAKACFSSKVEYRAVIRYLYLKGKTGKEIYCELADVYWSSAPSYAQVKFWVGEFKRGRTSSEDEARSGRPLDATDDFFFIWVLRPFQEYFTYIEPIVHRRWAKTGEPGEKPPGHP